HSACCSMPMPLPPTFTLFPYTTLFRSGMDALTALSDREARRIFQQHAQAFARYRQRSGGVDVAVVSTTGAAAAQGDVSQTAALADRKSTRLNSSHVKSSYAVLCLKKKK